MIVRVELVPVAALYVDDLEGLNSVVAQLAHEVVATQRSEEPVSRTRLNVCDLGKNEYLRIKLCFDLVTYGVPMLTTPE